MTQLQISRLLWFLAVIPFSVDAWLQNALKRIGELGRNNSQCNLAIRQTYQAAENGEVWALKILDATAKFSAGQLLAPPIFLGQYDECLSAMDPAGGFIGQYCLVKANFTKLEQDITNYITNVGQPVDIFQIALCIPSVCSFKYIEEQLNNIYLNVLHFKISDHSCMTKETILPLTKLDYSFLIIITTFVILAIVSTAYDCYQLFYMKNDRTNQLYCCFSLFTNGKNLLHIEHVGQYGCLNGLKALSMVGIVYGHSAMLALIGNASNRAEAMLGVANTKWTSFNNAHSITDTFFVMGSMLLVATFFREIKTKGGYDYPLAVIKRYLRLTPTFALLVLYVMSVQKYHIFGPSYSTLYDAHVTPCFNLWPMCLTYTQNYLSPVTKCVGHSWYLDVDMQLFWISPIFLYPVLWWPKIAATVALSLSFIAASYEFYIGLYYDLAPVVTYARTFNHLKYDNYLTHTRCAPWFLGIFLGFIFVRIVSKGKDFKMSKKTLWLGWGICGGLFALSQIPLYFFGFDYEQPMSALCLSYRRLTWSLGIGWIIIACTTSHGGWFNKFLCWAPFSFLSKISYNMYLIHLPLMEIIDGYQRDFKYASVNNVFSDFILYTVVSIIVASMMSLLVEMPCSKLVTIAFRDVKIFPYPSNKKSLGDTQVRDEEIPKN